MYEVESKHFTIEQNSLVIVNRWRLSFKMNHHGKIMNL